MAQSDEVRARVEKASLCAGRAGLSAASMRLVYDDGVCKPDLAGIELDSDLLERYATLCAQFGVTMDNELTHADAYINDMRTLHAGMKAVKLENETWRVVLLPESNAKIVEMTYKPTGRNVIQPARALDRFRYEEWVRVGEGPTSQNIVPHEVQAQPDKALLTVIAKDGARIERSIALVDDAIRFETVVTADAPRPFDFYVHPEYDAGNGLDDPDVVSIYVKESEWVHANKGWQEARPTEEQNAAIRDGVSGGVFAYYNHRAEFGVEQRFDPDELDSIALFWSPARQQINLELLPRAVSLERGQQARYAYEVRYLIEPPMNP